MNYQERTTWVNLSLDLLVVFGYSIWLISQLSSVDSESIEYTWVLIGAVVLQVVATIISQIFLAGFAGKKGTIEDVRDKDIRRRSNSVTLALLATAFFLGLGFALREAPYFLIVHVMFYGGALASIATSATRLWFYRRGLS